MVLPFIKVVLMQSSVIDSVKGSLLSLKYPKSPKSMLSQPMLNANTCLQEVTQPRTLLKLVHLTNCVRALEIPPALMYMS